MISFSRDCSCFKIKSCQYAEILALGVRIEQEAQEMTDGLGVIIFSAEINHLFDAFRTCRQDPEKKKQEK